MEKNAAPKKTLPVRRRKQTAEQYRRTRAHRGLCILLRIVLVLTAVGSCLVVNVGCALGWITQAQAGSNWPLEFVGYGQMLLVSSGLLVLGAGLVLACRKNWLNWAAVGCAVLGIILCMIALYRVSTYAGNSGFYSQLMEMPVDTLYRLEILPTWIPFGCIVSLAMLQFFSYEARSARQYRKIQAEAKAPSILE